jgi:hypothetical protein
MAQFQLRAYTGKETGLMVIGTASDYRSFAEQLVHAADTGDSQASSFPPEIYKLPATGPYSDRPDFELSFHLVSSASLESALPLKRASLPTLLLLGVLSLCVIGAITVVRWVAGFAP